MTELMKKPALLLLPNLIAEHKHHQAYLPASVDKAVLSLDGLIAENPHAGRRYLNRFMDHRAAANIPIALCNKQSNEDDINFLLEPIVAGERWGFVSDAGLPCLADPGALLVGRARKLGLKIQAFSGPSSLFLSLMLSGFNCQRFAFHGYLPKEQSERLAMIRQLEDQAERSEGPQLFIEAPHRNTALLEDLLDSLKLTSQLCVAWDLTLPTQGVVAQSVELWKKIPLPNIHKKPAVFLIQG